MRRSSAREGQIEPLAALAAVAVVAAAVALYAGVFEASLPGQTDRNVAEDAADRVERSVTRGGVVRPSTVLFANRSRPEGYHQNVTVVVHRDGADSVLSVGPAAPETADVARRRVSVRDGPGRVEPGHLEVRVWA
jgi:hypothetical protein